MYYPYLRGKQYELLMLRENAEFIKTNNIHPIIEPVKEKFASIKRALAVLNKMKVEYVLVANPQVGDLEGNSHIVLSILYEEFLKENDHIHIGFIINANTRERDIEIFLKNYKDNNISLIHYGFTKGKALAEMIVKHSNVKEHIFIEKYSGKLYRMRLKDSNINKILIRDGFRKQMTNKDYPESEHFSDLHATFTEESVNGFGDFIIVGDQYFDGGGKMYTLAIHITYIEDDDMFIYHFISGSDQFEKQEGKFITAINKLHTKLSPPNSNVYMSKACMKFMELRNQGHYPGLGTIKKLSMQHHIELIADFLK